MSALAVTQEDVARRAGVARKTVSNVISDYPHVSDRIRKRVLAAIEELGYQPNRAAQNLRTGRSGMIGLAVPELDVSYFAELTRLVVQATERRGLTVLIIQTFGDLIREHASLNGFGHQRLIDGLICSPIASSGDDILNRGGGFPVVLLGEQVSVAPDHAGIDHVGIDNVAAARTATEHLLSLPRRRVAFVGASRSTDSHMADLRLAGYRQALASAGVPLRPELVFSVNGYHRRDGAEAGRRILALPPEERPDGVFCANDLLAQGLMRALHDTGYRIPHDVAVVGFDDIDEATYSIPSLTSVSPDKAQIAETAVALLLDRVNGSDEADHDTVTDFSLVVRESTAGPRR
ncbi:LacI family DNA-binding transcriptional regulator [Dactylosporangium sp. NPDC005555]|uniref:LacI family DNA-binding transcriptional regulator n=1 Tax=Dactylosporangium sp. NPDC005555 TaxID=3154889 RepID=UPI0033A25366